MGNYAGNFRAAYFNGMPLSLAEDPFDPETDANKPPRVRGTFAMRLAPFYGQGETPPLVSSLFYDGKGHTPLRPPRCSRSPVPIRSPAAPRAIRTG